ncbi:MAG: tyrosine-protein kinase family protein [Betaproteobacteria bacterium]|nr:MAG: tyrosine-protein kinase family protein [Betaproteobacteria bacterium]
MNIIEKAASKLDKISSKNRADGDIIEKAIRTIENKEETAAVRGKIAPVDKSAKTLVPESTTPKLKPKRLALNFDKLRHYGIITPEDQKTAITEQFRVIKRPLLMNSFNKEVKNGNLIMVSSSLAGEGKSFCAVNLAMSIAMEMDHTVLLVDADVTRPMIPKILGLGTDKGLLDVLLDDKLDMTEVLIKTNIEKLSVLTAGRPQPNANELLASQSMGLLLKEFVQRYEDRIIIFDSPPLLQTSEARVLANQMGQIVLVVEAEKTTQQTVREALRQIETCEIVTLIYNKAKSFVNQDLYVAYKHD